MGYDKIPRQKLPISKKNKKWREECIDAFINLSNSGIGYNNKKDDIKALYDYYNGIIEDADYSYVLKPYGKSRKNFPSKMRNYPRYFFPLSQYRFQKSNILLDCFNRHI